MHWILALVRFNPSFGPDGGRESFLPRSFPKRSKHSLNGLEQRKQRDSSWKDIDHPIRTNGIDPLAKETRGSGPVDEDLGWTGPNPIHAFFFFVLVTVGRFEDASDYEDSIGFQLASNSFHVSHVPRSSQIWTKRSMLFCTNASTSDWMGCLPRNSTRINGMR